jgi:hypothetical protein
MYSKDNLLAHDTLTCKVMDHTSMLERAEDTGLCYVLIADRASAWSVRAAV